MHRRIDHEGDIAFGELQADFAGKRQRRIAAIGNAEDELHG